MGSIGGSPGVCDPWKTTLNISAVELTAEKTHKFPCQGFGVLNHWFWNGWEVEKMWVETNETIVEDKNPRLHWT